MNADQAPSRVTLDVSLDTLFGNFRKIQDAVAPLGVIVVLKANAYGLGMPRIAEALGRGGAAAIAVAELSEALSAQEATGGRIPVASPAEARAISDAATRLGTDAICHFAIDTGMSRVGFLPEEAAAALPGIARLPRIRCEGIYSHFPTANLPGDEPTAAQLDVFRALLGQLAARGLRFPMVHIANSDGINNVAAACAAPFTHVRTGINLYGSFDPLGNRRLQVQPVLTLRASLAQVRHVKAGATIGYGRTYTCPRDMLVGTVAAGYADGLPLALSNRGTLLIRGRHCPVIGRICMDYTTVALDQVPDAAPGDEVVCLGRQGDAAIPIDTWASLKGTHAYEILGSIGSRVRRRYV